MPFIRADVHTRAKWPRRPFDINRRRRRRTCRITPIARRRGDLEVVVASPEIDKFDRRGNCIALDQRALRRSLAVGRVVVVDRVACLLYTSRCV